MYILFLGDFFLNREIISEVHTVSVSKHKDDATSSKCLEVFVKKTAAVRLRHAFRIRRKATKLICDVFPLCGTNSCTVHNFVNKQNPRKSAMQHTNYSITGA